jgi:hypothetical protein
MTLYRVLIIPGRNCATMARAPEIVLKMAWRAERASSLVALSRETDRERNLWVTKLKRLGRERTRRASKEDEDEGGRREGIP